MPCLPVVHPAARRYEDSSRDGHRHGQGVHERGVPLGDRVRDREGDDRNRAHKNQHARQNEQCPKDAEGVRDPADKPTPKAERAQGAADLHVVRFSRPNRNACAERIGGCVTLDSTERLLIPVW
jgi:hypothetical protein